MSKRLWIFASLAAAAILAIGSFLRYAPGSWRSLIGAAGSVISDSDENEAVPEAVTTTQAELKQLPQDPSALGGYDVLIADRGNNRLVEVAPDKHIVWEYRFDLPKRGLGADDAFFTDQGRTVIVNLENDQVIQQIDYAAKRVTWEYGKPGVPGSSDGFLNTPDDAYKLPNGDIIVTDIKNCRVLEISPDKRIVRQYGETGRCGSAPGLLNKPNGDTPLPNGHLLISNISGRSVVELDEHWQEVLSFDVPLAYPSDPQPMRDGNILVSDYSNPGKIVEVSRTGQVIWQYFFTQGGQRLNKPSLAIELPNGNILCNDDFNHRVIIIDKASKKIIWQYGVTGKPGEQPGQLNTPDGVDIIQRSAASSPPVSAAPVNTTPYSVGYVMRQAATLQNTPVSLHGFVLSRGASFVIISDESSGPISRNDLPVTGPGIADVTVGQAYSFTGELVAGSVASNGNPYHFELTENPKP